MSDHRSMGAWGDGRRTLPVTLVVAGLLAVAACTPDPDPAPVPSSETADPTRTGPSWSVAGLAVGDAVVTVAAAGDIARNPQHGEGTAALIEELDPDAVLALGDNAYQSGTAEEYLENYDPTWGRFKDITRPIPGNHEYRTDDAGPYFDYFADQVHGQAYYAWDAGTWRMYALNCDIECGRDSEQLAWLRQDLAEHDGVPALAYVHEPLYTCSTRHPPRRQLDDVWAALDEAGGALLLSGNNHAYERFAPQDERGRPSAEGMRQFVVGTGGVQFYPLESTCRNREAENDTEHGVLHLELRADSYSWQFVAVGGDVRDEGEQRLP